MSANSGFGQEGFVGLGDDFGGCGRPQAALLGMESLHQLLWRHGGQFVRVRADPNQVLQGLALPEIRVEQRRAAFFGGLIQDDQTGKDAVEVADDLVLEDASDFDLAQAHPVYCDRFVGRAFAAAQQVADGRHVNLVTLFPAHELLLPVLLDRETVDQLHRLRALEQMAGQVLEIVAGGFHTDQYYLSPGANPGLFNLLTQLLEPALVDVNLKLPALSLSKGRRHDLTAIVNHCHMKVFADIQGDAQDLLRWNTPDEIDKSLTALTAQMGKTFLAQRRLL